LSLSADPFEDRWKIVEHLGVPKADHPTAESLQVLRPILIVLHLFGMGRPVDLNNQSALWAIEIEDKRTDCMLAPELQATQLPAT